MKCDVCGNDYNRPITIAQDGRSHTFDCFACAIHALAPACAHCGVKMIGQGVDDASGRMYCCDHCLRLSRLAGEPRLAPPPSAVR